MAKDKSFKTLWSLYITFFKIGGFTIGGGYAMIPIMQKAVVDDKEWVSEEDIVNFVALGQSIPGVIAINIATLVGYKVAGIPGAIAATAGMATPSVVIIMIIAAFFGQFQKYEVVQKAFSGIRAGVVAMMAVAIYRMVRVIDLTIMSYILMIGALIVIGWTSLSPIWVILSGGLVGLIMKYRGE